MGVDKGNGAGTWVTTGCGVGSSGWHGQFIEDKSRLGNNDNGSVEGSVFLLWMQYCQSSSRWGFHDALMALNVHRSHWCTSLGDLPRQSSTPCYIKIKAFGMWCCLEWWQMISVILDVKKQLLVTSSLAKDGYIHGLLYRSIGPTLASHPCNRSVKGMRMSPVNSARWDHSGMTDGLFFIGDCRKVVKMHVHLWW